MTTKNMSKTVTVVLAVNPATTEFDADFSVIDIHGGYPPEAPGHLSDRDWVDSEIQMSGLPCAIWPDEVPRDVLEARKVIVLGHMETERSGNPMDGYETDSFFIVENYRIVDPKKAE